MKALIQKGATSQLVHLFIQDSSSTTGAGLTGLTSGSSGLVCYRARGDDGNAAGTQLVLSGGTRGTWSSGGFVEKDSTNMPGLYELGLDNAGLVTGVDRVIYMLKGATNMAQLSIEIELVAFNPQNANLGITNVSANLTQVNAHNVTDTTSGIPDVNAKNVNNATAATMGSPAGASISADIAAIKSDTGTILTDVNTGAGAIYTRLGAPAGASMSADIAAVNAKTTNLPSSPAAVGSAMTLTSGERNSVADSLLDRDMSTGADTGSTTVRTVRQALRFLRNKWSISGSTLTVTKEDDTTSSWTSALTTDATANPVTASDPAG